LPDHESSTDLWSLSQELVSRRQRTTPSLHEELVRPQAAARPNPRWYEILWLFSNVRLGPPEVSAMKLAIEQQAKPIGAPADWKFFT